MTYLNACTLPIVCGVLFVLLLCAPTAHAYDVFDSLEAESTLPLGEQLLKIIDGESLENSRLKDVDIDETSPRISVPMGHTLVVGLYGRNWVLDARASDISQSDKSAIIWQGLQESGGRSIFVFTRDAVGTNKLVFSRSDNATADAFWYSLSIDWIENLESGSALVAAASSAPRVLLTDSHATVVMVAKENVGDSVGDLFSGDDEKVALGEPHTSEPARTVQIASEPVSSIFSATQGEKNVVQEDKALGKAEADSASAQASSETSELSQYDASLKELNELLKVGDYGEAQDAIAQHKNSVDLKDAVPRLLFDSARYLETMHEREGVRSIQNIEKAMVFYERIVDEYPLSIMYGEALARYEFLQKKYRFIR